MKHKTELPAAGEQATSERILSAAVRCIARRGYANVSLRDIAAEAGVVLSQLNYYYTNREGLFIEVLRSMVHSIRAEVEQGLGAGSTPREHVSGLVSRFQQLLSRRPEFSSLLLDLTSMSQWREPFRALLRDFYNDLYILTETHLASPGAGTRYSPKAMARAIVNTLVGEAMQAALAPEEPHELGAALSTLCTNL